VVGVERERESERAREGERDAAGKTRCLSASPPTRVSPSLVVGAVSPRVQRWLLRSSRVLTPHLEERGVRVLKHLAPLPALRHALEQRQRRGAAHGDAQAREVHQRQVVDGHQVPGVARAGKRHTQPRCYHHPAKMLP
jgi:hypothetical protein